MIDIPCHIPCHSPCHSGFEGENVFGSLSEQKDDPKDDPKGLSERQAVILDLIREDATITRERMTQKMGLSDATLKREISILKEKGFIARDGGRKEGRWVILKS